MWATFSLAVGLLRVCRLYFVRLQLYREKARRNAHAGIFSSNVRLAWGSSHVWRSLTPSPRMIRSREKLRHRAF